MRCASKNRSSAGSGDQFRCADGMPYVVAASVGGFLNVNTPLRNRQQSMLTELATGACLTVSAAVEAVVESAIAKSLLVTWWTRSSVVNIVAVEGEEILALVEDVTQGLGRRGFGLDISLIFSHC